MKIQLQARRLNKVKLCFFIKGLYKRAHTIAIHDKNIPHNPKYKLFNIYVRYLILIFQPFDHFTESNLFAIHQNSGTVNFTPQPYGTNEGNDQHPH